MKPVHALAIAAMLFPIACESNPNMVSRSAANSATFTMEGEVVHVRDVEIAGGSAVGAVAGGGLGFLLGSQIGGGRGNTLATIAGTAGGAAAGASVQRNQNSRPGQEVTVRLDNGSTVTVVQPLDRQFRVGDSVQVMQRSDGTAQVLQ